MGRGLSVVEAPIVPCDETASVDTGLVDPEDAYDVRKLLLPSLETVSAGID